MSKYTVIKDIGDTMLRLLRTNIASNTEFENAVGSNEIVLGSPESFEISSGTQPKVVLFLYKVDENRSYINNEPENGFYSITVDIHYLFMVSCPDDRMLEHKILGKILEVMRNYTVLRGTLFNDVDGLKGSDEEFKVILNQMSLDDLSKIWSGLPKTGGKTFVSYLLTPVTIDYAPVVDDTRVVTSEMRYRQISEEKGHEG